MRERCKSCGRLYLGISSFIELVHKIDNYVDDLHYYPEDMERERFELLNKNLGHLHLEAVSMAYGLLGSNENPELLEPTDEK